MNDQTNLFLAVILSLFILAAFEFLYGARPSPPPLTVDSPSRGLETGEVARDGVAEGGTADSGAALPGASATGEDIPVAPALRRARPAREEGTARAVISGRRVSGSVALTGGYLDDLVLDDYRRSTERDSPPVRLLRPVSDSGPYYIRHGWVSADASVKTPGSDAVWRVEGEGRLTSRHPLVLVWENGQGVVFRRELRLDDDFMFTVTQRVVNGGGSDLTLHPYALLIRTDTEDVQDLFLLHEGAVGYLGGALVEEDYDDVVEQQALSYDSEGGWLGVTDKYWLAALVLPPDEAVKARFVYNGAEGQGRYQADFLGSERQAPAGGEVVFRSRVFAGAKDVRLLDAYEETLGVARFDLAVDFGWFYFLTKPIFYALVWLQGLLHDMGLAILALTVLFRIFMYPLADKSFRAMNKMRALQPEFTQLRERYKDDRPRLQQEVMALYKKRRVNPAAGCLPLLLQLPIFFALYKVLFVALEMRQAPFLNWIDDLSATDPSNVFTLFGLVAWDAPSFLHIGIWPLLMGGTMYIQQKLNPAPADPMQARLMMMLPVVFTVVLAAFPVGLVIYWAWNNLLSIAQQYILMRRMEGMDAGRTAA